MSLNAGIMSSKRDSWNTPECILDLVRQVDEIGLDPCSNEDSIVNANVEWYLPTDGLSDEWDGRGLVYVNPPYGREIGRWVTKCYREGCDYGVEVIALLPARTDARWFGNVWTADALCFWRGRLKFLGAPSSAPFPSVLAYWGDRAKLFARVFGPHGHVVR